jgi:hypothetical protein
MLCNLLCFCYYQIFCISRTNHGPFLLSTPAFHQFLMAYSTTQLLSVHGVCCSITGKFIVAWSWVPLHLIQIVIGRLVCSLSLVFSLLLIKQWNKSLSIKSANCKYWIERKSQQSTFVTKKISTLEEVILSSMDSIGKAYVTYSIVNESSFLDVGIPQNCM